MTVRRSRYPPTLGWGGVGGHALVTLEVQKSLSKNVLSFKVNHPKHVLTRV